jgi:magnesium transporter
VFKVIDLPPNGKPEETQDLDRLRPPPEGTVRWVDIVEHDAAALEQLRERFGFHPLAIEDCASFEMRSKLEEYDSHLFVVLHTFTADPEDPTDIQIHEIHAFLSENYLVTVHDNPVPACEAVWERAARDRTILSRGPCWALYMNADTMVDATFPILEQIADELERVEESVLGDFEEEDLAVVFQIKRTLATMRRVVRPVRDVVGILHRRSDDPRVRPRTALYLRDVYDHVLRVAETIEEARDLATTAMDAYQTTISNRTNEVMKKLTIFSAIFLPLGFITGFWGQNFADLPVGTEWLFYVMLGAMGLIPASLLVWFGRRNWL